MLGNWLRVPSLACKFTGVLCSYCQCRFLFEDKKICRGFLWSGPDMVKNKGNVAWKFAALLILKNKVVSGFIGGVE